MQILTLFHTMMAKGELKRHNGTPYEDVAEAMKDIQTEGEFNPKGYEAIYQASTKYANLLPSKQTVTLQDWLKLKPAVELAAAAAGKCATGKVQIEKVFGPKADVEAIAAVFTGIQSALGKFGQENFETDYNRDAEEMRVAGASAHNSGIIQLSIDVFSFDPKTIAETLVHESSHETAGTEDLGYRGSSGFRQMTQARKANNADHYAELAARALGTSPDMGVVYLPREGVGGGVEPEDIARKKAKLASDGLEALWNLTIAMHSVMRDVAAGTTPLTGKKTLELVRNIKAAYALPLSKMALSVTAVDIALLEAFGNIFNRAQAQVKPSAELRLESMALNAIMRVGGFDPLGREENKKRLFAIRSLYTGVKNAADVFTD